MTTAPTTDEALAIAATAPPATEALIPARVCPNCSTGFQRAPRGPGQRKRFCSDKCRTTWSNREKAEGAALVTVAKAWRKMRGSGPLGRTAFAEVCSILDTLNDRDVAAGRLPLSDKGPLKPYLEDLLSDRYIDRARTR